MWLSKIVKSPRDSGYFDCSFNTNLVMVIKSVRWASAAWSIFWSSLSFFLAHQNVFLIREAIEICKLYTWILCVARFEEDDDDDEDKDATGEHRTFKRSQNETEEIRMTRGRLRFGRHFNFGIMLTNLVLVSWYNRLIVSLCPIRKRFAIPVSLVVRFGSVRFRSFGCKNISELNRIKKFQIGSV